VRSHPDVILPGKCCATLLTTLLCRIGGQHYAEKPTCIKPDFVPQAHRTVLCHPCRETALPGGR